MDRFAQEQRTENENVEGRGALEKGGISSGGELVGDDEGDHGSCVCAADEGLSPAPTPSRGCQEDEESDGRETRAQARDLPTAQGRQLDCRAAGGKEQRCGEDHHPV